MTGTDWLKYAACQPQPGRRDLWFSNSPADRRLAAHICLHHCPVFAQCEADRDANGASGLGVHAGVRYDDRWGDPRPKDDQPDPNHVRCVQCGITDKKPKPAPLTDQDVAAVRELAALGLLDRQIAARTGYTAEKVRRIRHGHHITAGLNVARPPKPADRSAA